MSALPERVVVGANGAYWRDYGDSYSMCPVSDDNDPVVPVAVYVREEPDGAPIPHPVIERIRARHVPVEARCEDDGRPWPCDAAILLRTKNEVAAPAVGRDVR